MRARLADGRFTLRALALYALLAILLFGLPVLGDPSGRIIAVDDQDPSFLIWMLAWWPHALLHGLNPLITHAIFYPDGYNLAWSTSMPLAGVALAPITLTAGPEVSWNILALLCPALTAWTTFLLCRHLTGARIPSLAGGFLFGFSPYVTGAMRTAPNIAFVALLPLLVLLCLRHLEGSLGRRRFVIAATAALVAQFLMSTEILATATLFGAITLLVAFPALSERRAALTHLLLSLAIAYGITVVLVSPYLYAFFAGHHYPPGLTRFQADLAALVVPPEPVALHIHSAAALRGTDMLDYLGLPWLALVVLGCWRRRRERIVLVALAALLVPLILSLGAEGLIVRSHHVHIWLPWELFTHLPIIRYAIPNRLSVFAMLPAAVIAASWLAARHRAPRRWVALTLGVLAVAAILPALGTYNWNTRVLRPAFFDHGLYRRYVSARDHVFIVPEWGPSQRWVADAGFPFALSTGSGGQGLPESFRRYRLWVNLLAPPYALPVNYAAELLRFLAEKRVTVVLVWHAQPGPWQRLFAGLHVRPAQAGGMLIYRIRNA